MKKIMVVKRDVLLADKYFQGFFPAKEFDFEDIILENYEWMQRENAEQDAGYKQPIGYCVIFNPKTKRVFLYQRSKIDANYNEKRLQGKWSCGIGGHIEKIDTANENPIHESSLREITEEVQIYGKKTMQVLGYINDDTNNVGKVHFGILYLVLIESDEVNPLDPEISEGKLVSINYFNEICASAEIEVENWSKIVLAPLKNI